jgi:hypothetical protein
VPPPLKALPEGGTIIDVPAISDEFTLPFIPVGIDVKDGLHPGNGRTLSIPPVGSRMSLPIAVPEGETLKALGGERQFEGFKPPISFKRSLDAAGQPEAVIEAVLQREQSGKERVLLRLIATDFQGVGTGVVADRLKAIELELVPQLVELPASGPSSIGAPARGGIGALVSVGRLKQDARLVVKADPGCDAPGSGFSGAVQSAAAASGEVVVGIAVCFSFDVGSLEDDIVQAEITSYVEREWTGRFPNSRLVVARVPEGAPSASFLGVQRVGQEGGFDVFKANTPGFSTFAVVALDPIGQPDTATPTVTPLPTLSPTPVPAATPVPAPSATPVPEHLPPPPGTKQPFNIWLVVGPLLGIEAILALLWAFGAVPIAQKKFVFVSGPQRLAVNAVSGPVTIEIRDRKSRPWNVRGKVDVQLRSNSRGGRFDLTPAGSFDGSVSRVTVPRASTTVTFYYKDSRTGVAVITVQKALGIGWGRNSQSFTITS